MDVVFLTMLIYGHTLSKQITTITTWIKMQPISFLKRTGKCFNTNLLEQASQIQVRIKVYSSKAICLGETMMRAV